MATLAIVATLLSVYIAKSATITGWIYADNWFELYFNGEQVAVDPLKFYPHNAVYINFEAPDSGLYSFAIWAQDFANDTTGLEGRITPDGGDGGWCLGDGGLIISLSDGTVSGSDWKCMIQHKGPIESVCQGECIEKSLKPSTCTVTTEEPPSCWTESECSAADSWSSASTYTAADIGWGRSPNKDLDKWGYTYPAVCNGDGANDVYSGEYTDFAYTESMGCVPEEKDWGSASFMWTADLNLDNRIICRYSYCVGGGTDCTAEAVPTTAPTEPTPEPSRSPLAPGQTHSPSNVPTESPVETKSDSGTAKLYTFIACLAMFVSIIVV